MNDEELHALVTPDAWEARKRFVGFSRDDEALMMELHLVARAYADEVMDELYQRWLAWPELEAHFAKPGTLERVKRLQREYFIRLTRGDYGLDYLRDRLRIGVVHRNIGLSPRWYMGAYATYQEVVVPRVMAAFEYDRTRRARAVTALLKLIALDQELALAAYFHGAPAPGGPSGHQP